MPLALTFAKADAELSDLSPDSVVVLDLAGTIRYWNPAAELLYGLPTIGAKGRNMQEMSANVSSDAEQWSTLLHEGVWEGVVQRLTAWGDRVVVAVRQVVRHDADGHAVDVVEFGHAATGELPQQNGSHDVSISTLAAAAWKLDLSAIRPLAETFAGQMEGDAPIVSPEHAERLLGGIIIADVNDRTVELVGAHAGRIGMIGQPLIEFFPAVNRRPLADMIASVMSQKANPYPRLRRALSDAILRNPVATLWRSIEPGRIDTLFLTVNGEADDDRSFSYMRASEARYRSLIHHLPSALLQVDAQIMGKVFKDLAAQGITDLDTYIDEHPELVDFANDVVRVVEANQEAVAMFGAKSPADFIQPVGFLFEQTPDMARRVMVARSKGRRNFVGTMKVKTFDGRLRDVRLSVTYPAPPERLDITLLYLDDITDQLRTEGQLRQLEADFTHSARISMIGELAASITHEVNQPLSAIVTNGETSLRWLMRAEPNFEKVADLTSKIVANARRAGDIVQRIRNMAANRAPASQQVDFNATVEEALLFLRHDLDSKAIEFHTKFAKEMPSITGDRVQLQQVVVNLILNGIQSVTEAQTTRPRLELETRNDLASVTVSIRDNGPGIDPGIIDRIFETFFTTKQSGVGIGLAICQSIVLAHGGNLAASNHAGGGAVFTVSLPVVAEHVGFQNRTRSP
ncbi:ATP-binding protein [Agrobacterium tumefaciens]